MKRRLFAAILALGASAYLLGPAAAATPGAGAADPDDSIDAIDAINAHLRRFAADPARVMREAPPRWDEGGRPIGALEELRFAPDEIASGKAIAARDQGRLETMGRGAGGEGNDPGASAEIRPGDRPETLVDQPDAMLGTLESLEGAGLRRARLTSQPWSDDYWGTYKGQLGARFADPRFPAASTGDAGTDWRANRDFVLSRPATAIVASGNASAINALSPAEKYAVLVGDGSFQLAERMWRIGEKYYNSTGKVETWMGLCHGWAPASFMLSRPERSVSLVAAQGGARIRFYPAEAKALATLLWANASSSIRFVGGRCNVVDPNTDANGRVIDPKCFDNNPGTWHLAVTNQVGIARRSFIFDATYDYQVWNQPVVGYSYGYFNPRTMRAARTIGEAKVPLARFPGDRYRTYRSARAVSVVGIAMDLTYVIETRPTQRESDSPQQDALRKVRYFYDLELDAFGKVVGGEWYTSSHPDFLWVPPPKARAASVAEAEATGAWDAANAPLPESWRLAATRAARAGQPLAKIVEAMLQLAR